MGRPRKATILPTVHSKIEQASNGAGMTLEIRRGHHR
jgi:hypothetical protein